MKISGTVVKGLGIGKKLGLPPTMNIEFVREPIGLNFGIYVVRVRTSAGNFDGVAHFGPRPAVKAPKSFEIHCFGLHKHLYGTRVYIEIIKRLRGVKNFRTTAALKKAIRQDIENAKRFLES